MIKKYIPLFFIAILFLSSSVYAQSSVNVDPLTGTANVQIPIYNLSSGQVAVPVSLVYSGSGVKPKDVEGTAGMNWNVQAGGQVSRLVRGLPDDCTKDTAGISALGWMSTSNYGANYATTFTFQNDNSTSTCNDETNDINNINSNVSFNFDTEPDVFYVSAPGLSCQLVYDRVTASFHPVVYQDLKISLSFVGGTAYNASQIASFTITNDKGITYIFSAPELVVQKTILGTGTAAYFKTKYNQYFNGVGYYDSWSLTSITDANGNGINLSYGASSARSSSNPVKLYIAGATAYSLQYTVSQTVTPQVLKYISKFSHSTSLHGDTLKFVGDTLNYAGLTGQTVITAINGMGRNFQLTYSFVTASTGYKRAFLRNFSDPGCSTPINYSFSYIGETQSGGNYTTTLPDSSSTQIDYWGYYSTLASTLTLVPSVYVNPTNTNYQPYLIQVTSTTAPSYAYNLNNSNNRGAHQFETYIGSLNTINYVTGGNTNITYEANDYYDVPSGTVVQGGGIRVKQIVDFVGNGSLNNITRNYSYLNPSTGYSSGKPVSLPQYAFSIPYSGSATGTALYTNSTALSAYDLSTEDHTIMYTNTKVSQTGAGSTLYAFYVPATNFDVNATPDCNGCTTAEWLPTTGYVARYTCSAFYGPIISLAGFTQMYPFLPNPNYDFERGLPLSISTYTDAGSPVSETDYTYQRPFTSSSMMAFKYDDLGPTGYVAKIYNRYKIFYNISELTSTVTKKIYDSKNYTQVQSSSATYTYGSTNHRLLTKEQATNSDGSTLTTYVSYVKDYTPNSGATNANINALYNLQQENINAPVETYQQVTRNSATTTIGAALTLYSPFTVGTVTNYLPSQQYKMVVPDGGSFSNFTINTGTQSIAKDSKYYTTANYDTYDNTGYPVTVDDNNQNYQTTIFDHFSNHATAIFKNARYAEIAFNDFDTDPSVTLPYKFAISGTQTFTPATAHAGYAYGLGTSQTISHTVTKNAIAQNYIFSIWANAASGTNVTLTVTYNTTAYTINFIGTGNWSYYELNKTISGFPSTFPVTITSNQQVAVDDILFYPDVSEAAVATYEPVAHYKVAETNTNGVSAYFTNDQWGRLLYAFDQDKNVVKKNTYVTPADVASIASPTINPGTVINGQPAGFGIPILNSCADAGSTVTWNFGDGSSNVVASIFTTPTHTYSSLGFTYTVSATINSPLYGVKAPPPVNITVGPAAIPLSYTSYTSSAGDISSVVFYDSNNVNILYTFTGTQLNSVHVVQGKYVIHVNLSDGQHYNSGTGVGYSSVIVTGSCWNTCANWVSTNAYQFSADLSNCTTSLAFTVSQYVCGS